MRKCMLKYTAPSEISDPEGSHWLLSTRLVNIESYWESVFFQPVINSNINTGIDLELIAGSQQSPTLNSELEI